MAKVTFQAPKKLCVIDMEKRKVKCLSGSMRNRRRTLSRQRKCTFIWKVPKGAGVIRVKVIGNGSGGISKSVIESTLKIDTGQKVTISI